MNKVLGKRLEIAEAILKELSKSSLRRSALERKVSKNRFVSYWCFRNVFSFLSLDGDIEKCSFEHRAAYRLTERGKQFLAWRTKS
jgi:predicted transcriptional regulator